MAPTWRLWHRYSPDPARLGLPSNTTSPAPPEGNGGRKNVEGGSEVPRGGLLDWEGERWTDDNGGEARAWEWPQGDFHRYTLAPAKCTELRPAQIGPGDPSTSAPLPFLPPHPSLSSSSHCWHPSRRWWVGWKSVNMWRSAINTVITLARLWWSQPHLVTVATTDMFYHRGQQTSPTCCPLKDDLKSSIWGFCLLLFVLVGVCGGFYMPAETLLQHSNRVSVIPEEFIVTSKLLH